MGADLEVVNNPAPRKSDRAAAVWDRLDRKADTYKKDGSFVAGQPKSHIANTMTVLRRDPFYRGRLREDAFSRRQCCGTRELREGDDILIAEWMGQAYNLHVTKNMVCDCVTAICREHSYHPVVEYLEGLSWDGTERVDGLFCRYFGADDTALHRTYSRCFLLSAVARVVEPACQVDTVPVLYGKQGIGKSRGLEALAGQDWFSDSPLELQNKDGALNIQGVWIYELSELDSLRGRELSTVKAFLSRRVDRFRAPFARRADDYPRQTVFVGTTNDSDFLADPSGSRRFWAIESKRVDVVGLKRDRDQIWAEAAEMYLTNSRWWLDATAEMERQIQNEIYERSDPWVEQIDKWSVGQVSRSWTASELLTGCLEIEPGRQRKGDVMRLTRCLRLLGYERVRRQIGGVQSWRWEKIP